MSLYRDVAAEENLLPIWRAQRPGMTAVPACIMRDCSLRAIKDRAIVSPPSLHCSNSIALAWKEAARHLLRCAMWRDVMPTHFLPAWMWSSSRCHHWAPPDTTQLTGCGFSSCYRNDHNWWLCLRKGRLGTSTQSSESNLTSRSSIYLLLEGQGRKKRCCAGWVTHIWLTSIKSIGVYWVYPVGMKVCYIRRLLYKEAAIHTYNTQQKGKKISLHTFCAQQGHSAHGWKTLTKLKWSRKRLVIRVKHKLPLPESQHKSAGHHPMLPATTGVQSK